MNVQVSRKFQQAPCRAIRRIVWKFPTGKFRWLHPKYKARHKCFYGGRGSAKSHSAARAAIILADSCRMRILCTREVQVSIAESMYRLIVELIQKMELDSHFVINKTEIRNILTGSVFIFRGLQDVKSMEGIDLAIVDEAQQVRKASFQRLTPTLRNRGAQMWWLWNPENEEDPVHAHFIMCKTLPPRTIVQMVNYTDNPNLSEEMIEEAEYMRSVDEPLYRHIWLGECRPKGIGWTFINPLWLDHAASGNVSAAPLNVMSRWAIGCDPAFQGIDLGVTIEGHGNKPVEMHEAEYSSTGEISAFLFSRVLARGRFNCDLGVDCVGAGIGVGDKLEEDYKLSDCLNRLNHKAEEFPEAVSVNFEFDCWRSQAWWQLRCDLEAGNIDLSELAKLPSWPLLVKEILAHQITVLNGKMRVTPKVQLRNADVLGWSPGRADALVAWNWVRKRQVEMPRAKDGNSQRDYNLRKIIKPPKTSGSAWL